MKPKSFLKNLILLLVTSATIIRCGPGEMKNYLNESTLDFDKRMEWWRDAGFGMFIHWGAYSVPAGIYRGNEIPGIGEWIMNTANIPIPEYEEFVKQFNPVKFDADEWARIAKDAGMKYIVITSKHHDGFCLWDSRVTEYDIIDFSPFGRDILKELSVACRNEGIRLCFYHSIMDWHHPDASGNNFPKYRDEYLKPQVKELITGYGDIGVMWFDGEWIEEWTEDQGKDLYNFVRNIEPDMIINNRVGKGRMGMQGMNIDESYAGDFGTPEQEILGEKSGLDWESCMTMNNTWGFKKNDHDWKPTEVLIHNLVDIAAKGGNYLLNVGPTGEGIIPQPSVDRLKEMGQWMKINGEVIHNSRAFRFYREGDDIRLVQSKDGETIYAVTLSWPGSSLTLESIKPDPGSEVKLLGSETPLTWIINEKGNLEIEIPDNLREEANRPCKYAWTFKIRGEAFPLADAPAIVTNLNESGDEILFDGKIEVRIEGADPEVPIHFTTNGSDPTPASPEYTSPVILETSTVIKAKAFLNGSKASFTAIAEFLDIEDEGFHCLNYEYYEGEWEQLPDFNQLDPLRKGLVTEIGLSQVRPRENYFGIVFSGKIKISEPGEYLFYTESDDGSRLYVNGEMIVDNDGLHGMEEKAGRITLKEGNHDIRITYFEAGGGNGIRVFMESPEMEKQEIPNELLEHYR
ncbi:MAG: alpha-L-fucosidase [Bacteroidales bacterium]|nr:MAG: alpha-L-fucosidase [Bacteroidales bacterium]